MARRIALIVVAGCLGGNAVLWFRTYLTRSTCDFLCAGSLGEVVEATVLYGGGLAIALVLPVTAIMTVAVMIVSGFLEPRVGSAGAAVLSPVLALMLVSTMGMLVFMAVRGVEFDLFGWLAPVLVGAAAITGMAMVPTVLVFLARRVVIGWDR